MGDDSFLGEGTYPLLDSPISCGTIPKRALLLAVFAAAAAALSLLAPQAEAAVPANGRSWELVTVNPPSSSRVVGMRPIRDDGERIVYGAAGPPQGSPSGAGVTYGTSVRGQSGWIDVPMGIPYEGAFFEEPIPIVVPVMAAAFAASEETIVWLSSVPLTPGAPPEGDLGLYRQLPSGAVQLIAKVGTGITLFHGGFADIARDGGRVVFSTEEHLLPGDAGRTQGWSIYAWDGGGLELVDVDNGGTLLSTCGSSIPKQTTSMSDDADRVFFTKMTGCGDPDEVYLRDLEAGTTTEISASLCTRLDCGPAANVMFAGATPDGDFAYMTTTQQLVNADEDSGRDLYRYNVASGGLSLLSDIPTVGNMEVLAQRVFPSDGGERVYFKASEEISPGTFSPRLYMADGSGTRLVAPASLAGVFSAEISLSTDGGKAVFVTETPVLGGDTDSQGDAYLYDADADTLRQISTGPAGGNGEQTVRIEPLSPMNRQEFEFGDIRPYYAIDAGGDRAFFQTAETLLPEDTNGVADVYEWRNGELGLVTPGYQPLVSELAGVSRDGRTVVFGTNASLVGRDADGESRDLYSARLGGGFAEPPPPPPGCDNATCPLPPGERVQRSTPPSVNQVQGKGKRDSLRVISVASKPKKGAIAVVVSVPAPGRVSGQIFTRAKGKKSVLAAGSTRAKGAGKVQLKLKLTSSALRSAGGGAKDAQLTVSQGSSKASQGVKVSLR